MGELVATVFVASLLGSVHCVAMCGPFVALTTLGRVPQRPWRAGAIYHLGRLLAYTVIGLLAGILGHLFDQGGSAVGIQQSATRMAGIAMVVVGLLWLVGGRAPRMSLGLGRWADRMTCGMGGTRARSRAGQFALGLATSLMPCGWLYAFAIIAAGTGEALMGAATMVVFWFGTLPALLALGLGVGRLSNSLQAKLPRIMAVALVLVGAFTAIRRAPIAAESGSSQVLAAGASGSPSCHDP